MGGVRLYRGQYHPLVRPALLASLFGYHWVACRSPSTLVATGTCRTSHSGSLQRELGTVRDGGLYDLYIGVMALEFAPALFERLGWRCRYSV